MKLPNGYGCITKLNDHPRRKPYTVRVKGKYIGYAQTYEEALALLADYHKDPWDSKELTFSDVWELWLEHDSGQIIDKTVQEYRRKYQCYCKPLYDKVYKDLRPKDFIGIMDSRKLSNGTKNNILKFFRALDRCAFKFGVVDKKYTEVIPYYKKEKSKKKNPFTEKEIDTLWKNIDVEDVDLVLILIYTGLRSGELADLKLENIHEDYLIAGFKTEAGTDRYIPIHPRIKELIDNRVQLAKKDTLLNYSAKQFRIRFKRVMEKFGMEHIPHECRHTFITRLDNAGANRTCINLIVGHKGEGVGESVYTHKTRKQLHETIFMLR